MGITDLFNTLHAGEVDNAEFDQILLEYFHGAMQVSLKETVYPGHETDYAMKLTYGQSGLLGIASGPRLIDSDVETLRSRVESELLTSTGTRIGREILFSHLSVKGYFRYQDTHGSLKFEAVSKIVVRSRHGRETYHSWFAHF
jgi:hypothetical protein